MVTRVVPIALLWLVCSGCSGGGGAGQTAFLVAGTVPGDGAIDVAVDADILVSFTLPADPLSVTTSTVTLRDGQNVVLPASIFVDPVTPAVVRVRPLATLAANVLHHLRIAGTIRSGEGATLGSDHVVDFITASPTPTIRPDQIIDLGDALNVPRYLARSIRLRDGRILVVGGYASASDVTSTAEVYDSATRTFRLLGTTMISPRAEHTLTMLGDGRVLVAGGVAAPGGAPLATTEVFTPGVDAFSAGPAMLEARRAHAASEFAGGSEVLVTGGVGEPGDPLATAERLSGGVWQPVPGGLPAASSQHLQVTLASDRVYVGVGNLTGTGALFDGSSFTVRQEPDARFRATVAHPTPDLLMIVGGDTRSILFYRIPGDTTLFATDLLHERRGAHSLSALEGGRRYLAAGGFNIAMAGVPALDTMEVVQFLAGSVPDVIVYRVENLRLPVPFAGHVAETGVDGWTVLAGGFGSATGPHSRRVVLIAGAGT